MRYVKKQKKYSLIFTLYDCLHLLQTLFGIITEVFRFLNWKCVVVLLGKILYAYFPLGPSSLPVAVTQPNEKLANGT